MAFLVSRKRSKLAKRHESREISFFHSILARFLIRLPFVILILVLLCLWSSSTTIISGNIVHVCVSSRRLNNLYCLSAGTQPNFEIPIPALNESVPINSPIDDKKTEKTSLSEPDTEKIEIISHSEPDTEKIEKISHLETDTEKIENISRPELVTEKIEAFSHSDPDAEKLEKASHSEPDIRQVVDPILEMQISKSKNNDEEVAMRSAAEFMQVIRSYGSNNHQGNCSGRGVYVYDLPSKFNSDLLAQCGNMIPWVDFCTYFSNDALGEPLLELGDGWYQTHQYALEPIFHSRVLKHPCRVYNEDEAKLFYVPYYGGLHILRWHFKNVSNEVKDTLGHEIVTWLESQKAWVRNSGKDHVFVLGKISWDFRRRVNSTWGTTLLNLEQMRNPIKLLIERQPWEENDIAIPHPTHFHPTSDNDILAWQLKIAKSNRKNLVSFAGAARPGAPENIRSILINQCSGNPLNCKFLDCSIGLCDHPSSLIALFTESEFCLQPPGDSPTRKSVFDSLVAGCIPVLFDPFTAYYQYPWHLPEDHKKYSVFIDQDEVRDMKVNVVERLMNISKSEREDMRRYIVYELLPGLVYGDLDSKFEKFQDAFSVTMNHLFEKVSRL